MTENHFFWLDLTFFFTEVQAWGREDLRSIDFYQSTAVQQRKSSLGLQATQYAWLIYLGRTIENMNNRLLVLSHNSILGGSYLWVMMWTSNKRTGRVMWLPPHRTCHIKRKRKNMAKSLITRIYMQLWYTLPHCRYHCPTIYHPPSGMGCGAYGWEWYPWIYPRE